ncbi:MAG: DUF1553 domain-containing protein, partial [Planctomycetaceae bacterium]|nr:DUF1553 domain-containing protein [Planctomycetaceae bacterium]
RAINADVPYDQFVVEHVAGDLLPHAGAADEPAQYTRRIDTETGRNESVLGTGFWFLGEWVHSPVDIRQEEADRFDNMIDVYSKTFLGLTVACARCHDHKFDPILQRDFYALQSFLQSSTYRQARFESMEQNAQVAAQLNALRAEAGPALLKAYAELVEPTANDADKYFNAAQSVVAAGVRWQETNEDQVLADFEAGTYGDWTTTGDAFGTGPHTQKTIADYQGDVHAQGTYFVNSHQRREGGRGDDHVGTLTSPEFKLTHRWIRFLVGGGNHAGKTCVNLLVDGKIVRSTTGPANNRMQPQEWNVEEFVGKSARIQLVDDERGGWGNIGADAFITTNSSLTGSAGRTVADFHPSMRRRLVDAAREFGVHVSTLSHWVALLAAEDKGGEFLSSLLDAPRPNDVAVENRPEPIAAQIERILASENIELIANYASGEQPLTDGPVFASGVSPLGTARLDLSNEQPILGLHEIPAIQRDRFWDPLTLAPGTLQDPGGTEGWQRAGRMLRTQSFEITQPKVFALVKGGVHTYACVDSHITIRGPLHGSLLRGHPARDDWHWIEHPVDRYAGHTAHLEFVPQQGDDFAVALVVQADRVPVGLSLPTSVTGNPASAPGERLRVLIEAAIHLMYGDHTVSAEQPELVLGANWIISHPELFGMTDENLQRLAELSAPYRERLNELRQQARFESTTAPALMDGTPEQEFVFIRGNWKKRGDDAGRQFLTVFEQEVKHLRGPQTRLDLALQMVDPGQTPLTARVIANRIWLHYFGRGLVPTPDDFGHLGQPVSHPELLDWLAWELIDHDWSLKHIHRLILSSAAYQMSSAASKDPRVAEIDPQNVLLHRMHLKRLEGEAIRDAMLAISGRLDPQLYGPSIPIHLTPFLEGR